MVFLPYALYWIEWVVLLLAGVSPAGVLYLFGLMLLFPLWLALFMGGVALLLSPGWLAWLATRAVWHRIVWPLLQWMYLFAATGRSPNPKKGTAKRGGLSQRLYDGPRAFRDRMRR